MAKKMHIKSQIAFAKKYIKNHGMDPDQVDLDALIDGKLSYKENLANIKKQLKNGVYDPSPKKGSRKKKTGPASRKIIKAGSRRKKKNLKVSTGRPARWTLAMIKAIKKSSDVEDPAGIVRTIWQRLSPAKRAQIKKLEAKGSDFKVNLPVPDDSHTAGPGIVRTVKPFNLVELQSTVGSKQFEKFRRSGMFKVMKSKKYGDRLVRRCKSKKGNLNVFIDR